MNQGKVDQGRVDQGRVDQGRVDQGRVDQGGLDQGRVDQGRVDQGRVDQGKVDQGKVDQGKVNRGKRGKAGEVEVERFTQYNLSSRILHFSSWFQIMKTAFKYTLLIWNVEKNQPRHYKIITAIT